LMKVLNVNMSLDPVHGGGSVERTFQISRHLVKAGCQCTVITTDIGLTIQRISELKGVDVVAFPTLVKRFYIPMFSYRKIKDIVKSIDIIHLINHWTLLNALVYIIARRLKKPYVVCPAGSLPYHKRSEKIKKYYNLLIGYRIIRNANGYIAISPDEIGQFREYGIHADNISLIPNGINIDDFHDVHENTFRKKFKIGDKPFVLFMGRLTSIKGPDLLLRAFCKVINSKNIDYHLVFAGPDEGMLPELKEISQKQGVDDKVHFIEYVGGIDKVSAYYEADLLVIPSRQEAMSIVVLEAGITGTPALLTDRCGFNIIEDIHGGKVVPATIEGLASGLTKLLSKPDQLESMGKGLRKYVYENYTWEKIINEHIALYDKILSSRSYNNEGNS